ncbi:hypothetical protein [Kaistella antarctica]|uniref:Uncharacterized protein n=1 Tax=Kaistella antarctica TaxID=266748 RepID=A0A3S4UHY2_9FLAO|nr:hypothetical protein [Kaistella antarctica]KEY20176.1 hypothetical protein HY04_02910 [Kaistella antarctica]SEV92738.1 hypothetical protein SAMN05421765_1188 [Kaistella antarctica]VEH94988.1 Uncharacterised protein [Kaistella antarctica]
MKVKFTILILTLFSTFAFAQSLKTVENILNESFQKIDYWSSNDRTDKHSFDSLYTSNMKFEKLLLKYTSTLPETINYNFELLKNNGLHIATSEDGLFRIYSWDDGTGGTMRFFKNIYQYKVNQKVFSKNSPKYDEKDAGCFYYQINDINSGNKKFYITLGTSILSSGLSYHTIKIFSIEDAKLNENAKLIKTKTGIRNQIGYEVDLTSRTNRDREVGNYKIEYDEKNKVISIPLILENSKVTGEKIHYQFKGKYFEKVKF